MKIYWTSNSIPELTGIDKTLQQTWQRQAYKANRKVWLGLGVMMLVNMVALGLILSAQLGMLWTAVVCGLVGATTSFINSQYIIHLIRPTLAQYRYAFEQNQAPHHADYFVPPAF